jgi:Na+-transporting NADH:ubiquinone oxidoreductase subunit NqrD
LSDPNPYEPPRHREPLTNAQVVKRGIGAGMILLFTPLAVLIAVGASCGAAIFVFTSLPLDSKTEYLLGWSTMLVPPALVLFGMLWWAVRAQRRQGTTDSNEGINS